MNARRTTLAAITTAGYLATIPTANWLITHYGPVPVGLGYTAPAGVYAVGLALVLRDAARETAGRLAVAAAIVAGAAWSYLISSPALATASAAAFLLSEGLDMAVYEPLRRRGLTIAMVASNAVGLAADSLLFLWLAFHSLQFLPGQLVGKAWMTALAVAGITAWHQARRPGTLHPDGTCTCRRLAHRTCGHCPHDACEDCGKCAGPGCAHDCTALAVTA